MFKKTIIGMCIASVLGLSGCSSVSIPQDNDLKEQEVVQPAVDKFESNEPAVIKRKIKPISIINPHEIPKEIKEKKVQLSLSNNAKLSDLPSLLEEYGIYLIVSENVDLEKTVYINNFKGNLEDLFEVIGSLYNISFNYQRNNIISVESSGQYVIDIPQDADIITEMENAITPLGAQDIQTSIVGGSIMYNATFLNNERIKKYVTRFSKNASVIGLQVAVLTVTLDKNSDKGFDWSKLNVAIGNSDIAAQEESANTGTINTGTGTTTPTETEEDAVTGSDFGRNLKDLQTLAAITGTGTTLRALNGTFDITGVINYLSTYGQTRTNQSVSMKTLSGKEVTLKSVQSIPYVSGISNSTTGISSSVASSTETEEVEVGLTLNMTPYYDSDSTMVSVNVELELSSLLSFVELSAGNQIGKITQPNTQEQTFTNFMKLKAGESSIIGGVMFETISDNRNSISYVEDANIASQNKKISKNAVFILLRPTVTVFGDFDKDIEIIQ